MVNKDKSLKYRIQKEIRKLRIAVMPPMCDMPLSYRIKKDMNVFYQTFGYRFDIYNPKSFTEKVHTYKLLYDDPLISRIVDKYEFKTYITEKLGRDDYVAKAYGVWDSIDALEKDWDSLPEEFVLKSTISGDGKNILFINKSKTTWNSIKKIVKKWFYKKNTFLNSFSYGYYRNKPRVLAEEHLHVISEGGNLKDYKFFCFNGFIRFVYTTSRTFIDNDYPRTFFDLNWNKINASLGYHPTAETAEKPIHFSEMIEIAQKLSTGFPFVRIDFYDSEEKPLLGELTFYPTGGFMPIEPESFDNELGELFSIPKEKLLKNEKK